MKCSDPIVIPPDQYFDDGGLVLLLGITHSTLARARGSGAIRFTRRGRKTLYRGDWVRDWLDGEGVRRRGEGVARAK